MTNRPFRLEGSRVFVAGHNGMVGSAVVRRLGQEQVESVLTVERNALDLRRQADVEAWFHAKQPDVVILAAARVGGILANSRYPADFLYDNLAIQTAIIQSAAASGVRKLLFLGSSCIYPKMAPQPIPESALLTGPLEPTNQWYAIAKIAGILLCDAMRAQHGHDFISAMPTNLYGPGDNYDLNSSHVIPALIRKAITARESGASEFVVWGSGTPLREFLHADDLADALIFLLKHWSEAGPINVGSGMEVSISELAELIAELAGFRGSVQFDRTKPDGTPRKLMDSSRLANLGWSPKTSLRDGLRQTIRDLPSGMFAEVAG